MILPPHILPLSVIISMYNTEKYIAECLESLLAQTFTDFELIVVNNGSTDNSPAILESYVPKFEGRLKILNIAVNTGGPSIPRNKGLEFSRGKYIYFLDDDDVLTKTALEEMYTLAEKFQADVVQCMSFYWAEGVGEDFIKSARLVEKMQFKNPLFVNDNIAEKFNLLATWTINSMYWLKISRRDFLLENEIKFREIIREDEMWTFEVLFWAKKFLLVPNACVFYRIREGAMTHSKNRPLNKHLRHWLDRMMNGLNLLNDFLGKFEFFRENPNYRYAALNNWISFDLQVAFQFCANLPKQQVYEVFKNEFEKDLGEKSVLFSCLLADNIELRKKLFIAEQKINGETK